MTSRLASALLGATVGLLPGAAAAAPTTGDYVTDRTNRIYIQAELDPALGAEAGFGHGFVLPHNGRMLVLDGSLSVPFFAPGNFELETSLHGLAVHRRGWGLRPQGGVSYVNVSNEVSEARSLALPMSLAGGYFGYRFFAALQAQWRPILVTHVDHRFGTEMLLPGVSDGFVRTPGGHTGFGATGGITLARRLELSARIGVRLTQRFALSLIPITVAVGTNVRF